MWSIPKVSSCSPKRLALGSLQRLGDDAGLTGQTLLTEPARFGWLLADAEFDSEGNHHVVRQKTGALSVIPRPSAAESIFSAVKRKLSTRAPGRSLEMQRIQALLLGLTYNLYRLKPCSV